MITKETSIPLRRISDPSFSPFESNYYSLKPSIFTSASNIVTIGQYYLSMRYFASVRSLERGLLKPRLCAKCRNVKCDEEGSEEQQKITAETGIPRPAIRLSSKATFKMKPISWFS